MLITNKYANNCTICGHIISVEEECNYEKGSGISHIKCPRDIRNVGREKARKYGYTKLLTLKNCQWCKKVLGKSNEKFIMCDNRVCKECFNDDIRERQNEREL